MHFSFLIKWKLKGECAYMENNKPDPQNTLNGLKSAIVILGILIFMGSCQIANSIDRLATEVNNAHNVSKDNHVELNARLNELIKALEK
jgi:hypothetical protein